MFKNPVGPIDLDEKLIHQGWNSVKTYQIEPTRCIEYNLNSPVFASACAPVEKASSTSYKFKKANPQASVPVLFHREYVLPNLSKSKHRY